MADELFKSLFEGDAAYHVPNYQRAYTWRHDKQLHRTPLNHKQAPTEQELRFTVECKYFAEQNGFKGQFRSQVGAIIDLTHAHHNDTGCLVFGTEFQVYFASHHPFSTHKEFAQYLRSYCITPLFDFHPRGKNRQMARCWVGGLYTSL